MFQEKGKELLVRIEESKMEETINTALNIFV